MPCGTVIQAITASRSWVANVPSPYRSGGEISDSAAPVVADRTMRDAASTDIRSWPRPAPSSSRSWSIWYASRTAALLAATAGDHISLYKLGFSRANSRWLSQPARTSSATWSWTTAATARLVSMNAAQPKSTTAASSPSLSPKWWYRVGAVTPAASQTARVETSTSADWARRPAAVSMMRLLTVMDRD